MQRKHPSERRFLPSFIMLSVLIAGLASGCSGKQIDENDPAALYKDAEEEIQNDHYTLAIDKLRMIKNKFPYSKYSVDAQLRIADVYFLQEQFPEAATSYESFYDLHPKHEKVAYAMFRAAKSYYKDIPSPIARDLGPAQKALDAYEDFLKRFPQAPEAGEARQDANVAMQALAEKELYIGNFYFREGEYGAAKPRFQKVVELYPETQAAKEAREKIAKIDKK